VLINLLVFIEGDSSFQAPAAQIENRQTNTIAKRKWNELLHWETPRWTLNISIKFGLFSILVKYLSKLDGVYVNIQNMVKASFEKQIRKYVCI
jgi:hypothetical protein